ncbi:uncharacterized protein LOC120090796 [Benincasa hispida]|uniref:uncharacterized protein LOC120090796 n=1 Tax=Benincasa hispida TaxID=102211 RepID=UPI0019015BB2|nr:uncharacterized protein LOC120090796 [Benincasa hispida]
MSPFEPLYGRGCQSSVCWGEVGERKLIRTELVQMTNEIRQKIRTRMLTLQSRQNSYVDVWRSDLKFEAGDKVFLKVAPTKGVLRFGRNGKLNPHFVRPFKLNENLSYEEKPVQIIAMEVKVLHNREVALVKILWQNHQFEEAT